MLSALTGDPEYYQKARNAVLRLYDSRSATTGLAGLGIDVESGRITLPISQVGSGIDSYYEYLYKAGVLFRDQELLDRYEQVMAGVDRHLADVRNGGLWFAYADSVTGLVKVRLFGALSCYFGGLLGISGHLDRGERLTASCWRMWDTWGLAPEVFLYSSMTLVSGGYELRPEFPESLFYLWRLTGNRQYRDWGERVLEDLIRYCRAEAGYSNVVDVRTMEQGDAMASYFLAETLKYLYLLFAPEALDFDAVVFNTEAHPLQRVP
jgi:mannosidase alpha-like ER degradation enhancer 2